MLPFVIEKYLLLFSFIQEKKLYKNINEIAINMQTNEITWKIVILQKIEKRIYEFGVTMTEKH
jgi:hypothetical protein